MAEKTVTITNKAGIHCRPSSVILTKAQELPENNILIKSENGETDLSSILGLLSLGLKKGDEAVIIVDGPDADSVCETFAELFEYEFDFPPK